MRYDVCFPVKNGEWTKISVAWQDLVPVLPGPAAKPLGRSGGNAAWTAFGGRPGQGRRAPHHHQPFRVALGCDRGVGRGLPRCRKRSPPGLADTDHAFVAAGKNNPNPLFVHDRVHLSKAGHALVAETVLKAIEQKQKETVTKRSATP